MYFDYDHYLMVTYRFELTQDLYFLLIFGMLNYLTKHE